MGNRPRIDQSSASTAEWGTRVNAGRETLRTAWWISTFPGLMIAAAIIALNFLGDALRDILDPRFET